jgi:hypothetical protein
MTLLGLLFPFFPFPDGFGAAALAMGDLNVDVSPASYARK